jgi:hypothetical protein
MNNTIPFKEVIWEMDKTDGNGRPLPFSLTFITADRIRNTGGDIIFIPEAQKCVGKKNGQVLFPTPVNVNSPNSITKDPHHRENETRNIYLPNGQVRKVHVRLITKFNGKTVIP